ncbi:LPS translocon maturation chaperone LptM [Rhodoferax saidenbachensis]|uniref:Small lipoprotein YifL n=1 Tax=Rhodoferax saidenbachensis TaxID=1484693 RepID=A0ABU1ZJJ5_9BURK|nr:lipoprotein [Rhodoferax saidenbachensis]MDR7305720.1 putative small lipoprotein YifL [Rhodoferax saidenbachensis]
MLKATQILVSRLVLAASVLTVAACGQTGSLYLPSSQAARSTKATAAPVAAPAATSTTTNTTP